MTVLYLVAETESALSPLEQLGSCLFGDVRGPGKGLWKTKYYTAEVCWQVFLLEGPYCDESRVLTGRVVDGWLEVAAGSDCARCPLDEIANSVAKAMEPISIMQERTGLLSLVEALNVWFCDDLQNSAPSGIYLEGRNGTSADADIEEMEGLMTAIKEASVRARDRSVTDEERRSRAVELITRLTHHLSDDCL